MENSYRNISIDTLKKIFKNESYSNIVINSGKNIINQKYENLYRKSVRGVIENLFFIDYVINQVSSIKISKMELNTLVVLRLATYQLFFLDNSFENVVVSESVQFIKDSGNIGASKFVNAVLRNIIRKKTEILSSVDKLESDDYLSIKYSYPKELIQRWKKQFGEENIEKVLEWNNSEATLEIRTNTTKISRDELINLLLKENIKAEECVYSKKGIRVFSSLDLENNKLFKDGFFSVQSESSMLVTEVLNPAENSLVVDVCAAPGGKSLHAAEIMKNKGKVISRDIHKNKLSLIEKEKNRLNLNIVKVEQHDATIIDIDLINKADYAIVDAPCSGLGIIRRKPEIKYKKENTDDEGTKHKEKLETIQYKILENTSKYLKAGGELVYSTCTTNKSENMDIINKFLSNNKQYSLVDFSFLLSSDNFETAKDGYVEIYPHIHQMDGFFIAKIKKLWYNFK